MVRAQYIPKETDIPVDRIEVIFRPNMERVVSQGGFRFLSSHDPDIHGVGVFPHLLNGHPPEHFPLVVWLYQSPLLLNIKVRGWVSSGLNDIHSIADL